MLRIKKIIGILSLLGISSTGIAGSVTGTMNVVLNLTNSCQVAGAAPVAGGTTGVNFGTLDFGSPAAGLSQDVTGSNIIGGAGIALTCSTGMTYTVGLGNGQNFKANSRNLKGLGANATSDIPYKLYADAAYSTLWGTGTNDPGNLGAARTFTSDGNPISLTVYGKIPAQARAPAAGTYQDAVQVNITW